MFADAITKNRTDGALVRLTTPLYPGESEQKADERLQSFIQELEPRLSAYLPPETASDVKSVVHRRSTSVIEIRHNPIVQHLVRQHPPSSLAPGRSSCCGLGSPEDRAQSYYERGMKLLSQQDYVKASIEFKNALQLKKDLVGAWRGLAEIEDAQSNLEGPDRNSAHDRGA